MAQASLPVQPDIIYIVIDFDAIDIAGPHDARTIVFLHAASYTRKMWLPQMRSLSDEFRVVAIDMRGHGARSREPFDFEGCVDDVEMIVEKLGLGPVMFVGSSLGGCIAMELAQRTPRHVVGMMIAGSSFDPTTLLCKMVLTGESVVFPRAESRLIRHFQDYVRGTMHASIAEEIVDAGCHWRSAAVAVAQMRGRDFVGAMKSFDGPVMIVNGERDWPHRFYERRFLASGQKATLAVIQGANHICSLDAPEEFTTLVRLFADQCAFPELAVESE